jgi:ferredoxin
MAALLGLIQKLGRFRITVKKDMCIACGNCSTYCEMGIDVPRLCHGQPGRQARRLRRLRDVRARLPARRAEAREQAHPLEGGPAIRVYAVDL